MNYIKQLERDIQQEQAANAALLAGLADLGAYLASDKFSAPNDWVSIHDVRLRLLECVHASDLARLTPPEVLSPPGCRSHSSAQGAHVRQTA